MDDLFVRGFIEAALWAEICGEKGDRSFFDLGYEPDCLSKEAIAEISESCQAFQTLAAEELKAAEEAGQSLQSLGGDFYFARNRHGVGYWDLGDLGEKLSEKAQTYSPISFYLNDNDEVEAEV